MKKFASVLKRAEKRKGGPKILKELLPKVGRPNSVAKKPDDRFLAAMSQCVFQAGFVWRVIKQKWPGFEEAFHGFDPKRLLKLSPEQWEAYGKDTRIVRNMQKILSVRDNAKFISEISRTEGGFGKFVAEWPVTELVELWGLLKKRGSRLGGVTGQRFLRNMGKDSFILSGDVVACLQDAGVDIADTPSSKRDLAKVQEVFNAWHEESGLPYSHLSRIAAYSIGVNHSAKEIKGYMSH